MRFVLATANLGKIGEMREVLAGLGVEVMSRDELGIDIVVEETGLTFYDNALLKAEAICKASGLPAIADDSGLIVDVLGGGPGLYTSSYGGESLNDRERCDYLLRNMEGMEQRRAKFVSTIVCAYPDGTVIHAYGECVGEITPAPRGENGFGYDPVFIAEGRDKTMAELSNEEKNLLSHRGKALREFAEKLRVES